MFAMVMNTSNYTVTIAGILMAIAFPAIMALIKDGPQWQKEKWQVEGYLEEVGDRESCRFCVVQVLSPHSNSLFLIH